MTDFNNRFNSKEQSGGFLGLFETNGEFATCLALDAFNNNAPQVAYFVIKYVLNKNVNLDFSKVDENSNTLLHHLAHCCNNDDMCNLLSVILNKTKAQRCINMQNKDGNTPAHLAVINGCNRIIDELVRHGADLSILNANGEKISSSVSEMSDVFVKSSKNNNNTLSRLRSLVDSYVTRTDTDTINFRRSDVDTVRDTRSNIFAEDSAKTDDILDMIIAENLLNPNLVGGSKNQNTGRREIVGYSEDMSGGNENSDDDDDSDDEDDNESDKVEGIDNDEDDEDVDKDDNDFSDLSELARNVENQKENAHIRSVEKIMELLGIDEAEAKIYKAYLWNEIKNEMQGVSNYDKSMELEKRASDKELLKKIPKKSIKNMAKLIEDNRNSKSSEPTKPAKMAESSDNELSYDLDTYESDSDSDF